MKIKLVSEKEKLPKEVVKVEFSDGKEVKFTTDKVGEEKLIFGIGKKHSEVGLRDFFVFCRKLIRTAKGYKIKKLALNFNELNFPEIKLNDSQKARIMGEQFIIADFDFNKYKKEKESVSIKEVFIDTRGLTQIGIGNGLTQIKKEFEKGLLVGEEVNKSRELSNTPGGEMTPTLLARKAVEA